MRNRIRAATVAAVAIVVCLPGINNAFAHDDVLIILQNARVHDLTRLGDLFAAAYWPQPYPQDLYRPLTSFSLAVQWWLGAGDPMLFRAVSYLGYAAACIAMLALARRFLPLTIAFVTALSFAVHPVHVEAVALAVNQAEIAVAILATLITVRYVDGRREGALGPKDWGVIAGLYALACLFKESALVIPALLASAEVFLIEGDAWRLRLRQLWLGYASLAAVAIAFVLLRTAILGGQVVGTFTAEALIGLDIGARALTMLQVVPEWMRLLIWPAHLRVDYSPAEFVAAHEFGLVQLEGLALLVAGLWAIWFTRRRAPLVAFGLVWAAIALLPVSNVLVPTGILMAERTLFLPSVGFLLAVGGAAVALHAVLARNNSNILVAQRVALVACIGLLIAGSVRSMERQLVWLNNRQLWTASAEDAPKSWRVQNGLAGILFNEGRPSEGVLAYQRAIAASPEPWSIRVDLARRLRELGDPIGARRQLELSLAEHADQPDTKAELAAVLLSQGAYHQAKGVSQSGEQMYPALPVFATLSRLADSASTVGAPAGSIEVGIRFTDEGARGP